MPAWRASQWEAPRGQPRAELIYGTAAGSTAGMRPAEEMPQRGPEAGIPACQQTLRVGKAAANPVHGPPARAEPPQPFPVRDLGSGEAGFLLRHHDVTTRVGTGPRKTSSWTGSTLVQNAGSELSAFP